MWRREQYHSPNPFEWMDMISLQGKTNFFEKRVCEALSLFSWGPLSPLCIFRWARETTNTLCIRKYSDLDLHVLIRPCAFDRWEITKSRA